MKEIIFIDDEDFAQGSASQIQVDEMEKILQSDNNNEVTVTKVQCAVPVGKEDCLSNEGELNHENEECYSGVNQAIKNVLKTVNDRIDKIKTEDDRIEAVIDLCLQRGKHPRLGIKLAKYLINNMKQREYFENMQFVITLTSRYLTTYNEICMGVLNEDEMQKIEICYRPIVESEMDPEELQFDKTGTAFPKYYKKYHIDKSDPKKQINKLLADTENGPQGNTGTFYGNFFGLIYARLYK